MNKDEMMGMIESRTTGLIEERERNAGRAFEIRDEIAALDRAKFLLAGDPGASELERVADYLGA